MSSRIGATATLIVMVGGMGAAAYVMDHGLPDLSSVMSSVPTLSSVSSLPVLSPGLKFKVEYKSQMVSRQTQCGMNLCPLVQIPVMRLRIQSLNDQSVLVKNVVVNDNADCGVNPLTKLSAALKAEGRDPGLLSSVPATSSLTATMKYGDVATVPLFGCEPIRVRITTDRGEKVYDME
jgi:hypothetical protein